ELEPRFIEVLGKWADRLGADGATLASLGVERRVLTEAGLPPEPLHQRLRKYWNPMPFSASDLAGRSGVPVSSVRRAIAFDVGAGELRPVERDGSTVFYEAC